MFFNDGGQGLSFGTFSVFLDWLKLANGYFSTFSSSCSASALETRVKPNFKKFKSTWFHLYKHSMQSKKQGISNVAEQLWSFATLYLFYIR